MGSRNFSILFCRKAFLNRFQYLVGQNLNRPKPPAEKISEMYKENILPPYVVDGPGSAKVDMLSAISLLSQYCESLPADKYTTYSIDYYKEERDESCRVVIVMPLLCPIKDPIQVKYRKVFARSCNCAHSRVPI